MNQNILPFAVLFIPFCRYTSIPVVSVDDILTYWQQNVQTLSGRGESLPVQQPFSIP